MNSVSGLSTIDAVYVAILLVLPGLVIVYARSKILTGRIGNASHNILPYLAISLAYQSMALPILGQYLTKIPSTPSEYIYGLIEIIIAPLIIGTVSGVFSAKGIGSKLFRKIGIKTIHEIPNAWDRAFGTKEDCCVLVVLKNGTTVAGFLGDGSFASTDPNERDLFLDDVYRISDDGDWTYSEGASVLIASGEISTVDFIPK